MEYKHDGITAFDTLFTSNHICMLKLLLPMLPAPHQKSIAIYIKYLELQYTLQYFSRHPYGVAIPSSQTANGSYDFNALFESLMPYCTPREKESFTQMRNMVNTFRNMQEMMEMMNTIKELFPEGFDPSGDGISPEIFANFAGGGMNFEMPGSMDIKQMTDLFQSFQSGP